MQSHLPSQALTLACAGVSARLSSAIAEAVSVEWAERPASTRQVVASLLARRYMLDKSRASLAFKLGTNAARGPRPMIRMPHLWKDGARRRVNVTPIGTSAAERAVRPVRPPWRACGGHALHHLSGNFRIPVSKRWLLCFRAGNAAPMLSTKDFDLRQRTRAALHLDI